MRCRTSAVCLVILAAACSPGWAQSRARPPKPIAPRPLSNPQPNSGTAPAASNAPRVALEIACGEEEWGRIVLELDAAKAPQTVENFLRHVDAGYYNETIFHRVLPNFVIQGGGYGPDGQPKRPATQRPLRSEANNGLKNLRGTIAMARGRNPHSATTQFFINVVDNPKLDYPGHDGWGYCVFGRVVEGLPVVDRIRRTPTHAGPSGRDTTPSWPVNPPLIRRAYRLNSGHEAQQVSPTPVESEGEPPPDMQSPREIVPLPAEEAQPVEPQPESQPAVPGPDGDAAAET